MNTQDNRFLQQIGNAKAKVGDVLAKALFGEEIAQPETTVINNDGVYSIETGVNNGGRKGGLVNFINDARSGLLENSSQGFQASNLYPDKEKGAGFRLGEVAGSALRLLDNPLARGAIAYGLSKRMGDENPLGEALIAANLTRQNRAKDQMYRKALAERKIDTSGIRGYIGDDIFKSILEDAQLRDNAEYRNAMLQTQINNQRELMEYRKQEAERQARQDQQDNYFRGQQIAQGWEKLKQGENKVNTKEEAKRKQSQSTLNMIGAALGTVEQSPEAFGFWKGVSPNEITNRADAQGVQARAIVDSVTAEYRKYLTGAQMSDKERKDYEKFLPNPRDNADIIRKKLQGMQTVIQAREGLYEDLPISSTPNLNVDRNALEAEMKRRGLK